MGSHPGMRGTGVLLTSPLHCPQPWWSWMGMTFASLPVGKWLSVISSR